MAAALTRQSGTDTEFVTAGADLVGGNLIRGAGAPGAADHVGLHGAALNVHWPGAPSGWAPTSTGLNAFRRTHRHRPVMRCPARPRTRHPVDRVDLHQPSGEISVTPSTAGGGGGGDSHGLLIRCTWYARWSGHRHYCPSPPCWSADHAEPPKPHRYAATTLEEGPRPRARLPLASKTGTARSPAERLTAHHPSYDRLGPPDVPVHHPCA
jgi:hypothetical protein